ncbi:Calcium-dependent protein kinase, partial [Reticulomyxa filosa]
KKKKRCEGGELFDQIANLDGDHYSEEDCCHVMHQIANGVKYMHERGIVHRDLKPENILCVRKNSIKTIKIADVGISKMVKPHELMKTMVGTLSYIAPEILESKKYDHRVDYWSIGVIMFILLCGYPPFYGETDAD